MDKVKRYKAWMGTATSGFVLLMAIASLSGNRAAIGISSILILLSCALSHMLYKKWGLPDKTEFPLPAKVINFITIIILVLNLILHIPLTK